jgi:hypothetical protein
MSLTHIRKIGLPLIAAVAACAAAAAPAMAAPAYFAGTYTSWAKAQHAAGYNLLQPSTTYHLRADGPISVSTCEASPKHRVVTASYGSLMSASLELQQDNAGRPCTFSATEGTPLGTYKIHGHAASLAGFCGFTGAPSCTSKDIELSLTWTVKGDYYAAYSHDEARSALEHFATSLKKA